MCDTAGSVGNTAEATSVKLLRREFNEFMQKTDEFADFVHFVVKISVVMYLVLLLVALK